MRATARAAGDGCAVPVILAPHLPPSHGVSASQASMIPSACSCANDWRFGSRKNGYVPPISYAPPIAGHHHADHMPDCGWRGADAGAGRAVGIPPLEPPCDSAPGRCLAARKHSRAVASVVALAALSARTCECALSLGCHVATTHLAGWAYSGRAAPDVARRHRRRCWAAAVADSTPAPAVRPRVCGAGGPGGRGQSCGHQPRSVTHALSAHGSPDHHECHRNGGTVARRCLDESPSRAHAGNGVCAGPPPVTPTRCADPAGSAAVADRQHLVACSGHDHHHSGSAEYGVAAVLRAFHECDRVVAHWRAHGAALAARRLAGRRGFCGASDSPRPGARTDCAQAYRDLPGDDVSLASLGRVRTPSARAETTV